MKKGVTKNKFALLLGGIILIGTMFVVGYMLGKTIRSTEKKTDDRVINTAGQYAESKKESYESTSKGKIYKIAVVNLDEGITRGGERINYANQIVQFPSTSFEYSSLEEARTGVGNGKYGAYIIVPAGFSQSVASLNTTPRPAQLEYLVNKELAGEVQYRLLYDVVSFGESLNDNLSYMYLKNILSEFHKAQDGAVTVMNNDLKDKNAIEDIKPYDLVQIVEVPELKREDNTTETLDVGEYVEKNTTLATGIDMQYKKCVEEIQQQLQDMQAKGASLSEQLTLLSAYAKKLDVFKDEAGNQVDESADHKLNEVIEKKLGKTVESMLESMEQQPGIITAELNRSIDIYNQSLSGQLSDRLQSFADKILKADPELVLEETEKGSYRLHYAGSDSPELKIKLEDDSKSEAGQRAEMARQLWMSVTRKLAAAENEQEISSSMNEESGADIEKQEHTVAKSVKTAFTECEQESNLMAMCKSLGYQHVSDFMDDAGQGKVAIDKTYKIAVNGDLKKFREYVHSVISSIPKEAEPLQGYADYRYDGQGNIIIDPVTNKPASITGRLEDYGIQMQAFETELNDAQTTNGQEIKSVLQDFYIHPMRKNQEEFNEKLQQKYEEETSCVNEFNEKLKEFSPAAQDEYITENVNGIKENNGLLHKNLTENNRAYAEYANKVYTTTQENIDTLQKGIQDAKAASDQAVEDGLNTAKNTKTDTSKANQNILEVFSAKLPYTRLGSMEYTQTYQFITNPVDLKDISTDNGETPEEETKETAGKKVFAGDTEKENSDRYSWVYGIFAILLTMFCIFLVWRYCRNKRTQQ